MASSSPKIFRTHFQSRSVSLPSKLHHIFPEYDEILLRLQSSDSASSSSSSVRNNLEGLQDLHNCVDSLMFLPETQQTLARECSGQWVDQVLDGSLRLLDVCATAKDSLSTLRECLEELHSSLRRKGTDSNEAAKYLTSRKAVNKSLQKALRTLKGLKTINQEQASLTMVSMLKDVEQVTLLVLESVLSFVMGPKDKSLVSKMMLSKSSKSEITNEFEQIDAAMQSIIKQKAVGADHIQTGVANLKLSIEDLESGIGSLYRILIKTRVTLLNSLSN